MRDSDAPRSFTFAETTAFTSPATFVAPASPRIRRTIASRIFTSVGFPSRHLRETKSSGDVDGVGKSITVRPVTESAPELATRAVQVSRPADGLAAVAALRTRLDALEEMHVENALRRGMSWRQIAEALGVTKQAAHKKYAKRLGGRAAEGAPVEAGRNRLIITGRARHAVQLARQEAAALTAHEVGTEHLLLGLVRGDGDPAAHTLASLGVALAAARREAERVQREEEAVRGLLGAAPARPPISAAARRALEQSLREALARGDPHLGVEHVLLAVLRDARGGAARTLAALGVAPAAVDGRLAEVLAAT